MFKDISILRIKVKLVVRYHRGFVSKSDSFVPHFHIPLQSGSDELLKSMKRRYNTTLYSDRIERIKTQMPQSCIGVDVIVGYPGETEDLFLETYNYLSALDISYLHVFSYSQRANTEADVMENQIPKAVKNKRSKMMRILSAKKRRAFYESQLSSQHPVLFEHDNHDGFIYGFTDNYVKVKMDYDPGFRNQVLNVELLSIDDEDGLVHAKLV